MKPKTPFGRKLKEEFKPQLANARSSCTCHVPKRARTVVKVSIHASSAIELRMVEYVKELRAEFR
jgi:hypothetical protein